VPKPDAGVDVSGLGPQETYVALCAPCHAKDAKGGAADHAPSLVNPTFLESASDDYLRKSIALGRPGTSMAAYGKAMGGPLDDARVDGIVRWLREVGAIPAAKKLEQVAKGDALGGEKLYTEYCRTCHGDAKTRGGPYTSRTCSSCSSRPTRSSATRSPSAARARRCRASAR
jgi:cytochrome c oxidase cbb3-type subunit III